MKQCGDDAPELLTDLDQYLFFERSVRGGVSKAVTRHAVANNPYCPETYDETKPSTYLLYLDANNLYGHSMVRSLPHSNFKWDEEAITPTKLKQMCEEWNDERSRGFTAEVDLKYGSHLHEAHSDYPLAPLHETVREEELSDYSKATLQGKFQKNKKLMCTLQDKERYVVHVSALKTYIELGLVVTRVHRVITYTQKRWLKSYIDFNTAKRAQAKYDYQKNLYKLANNAVYGKCLESVRDRS
eukprot:4982240-Pleurochrysis_carterae.AAC.1